MQAEASETASWGYLGLLAAALISRIAYLLSSALGLLAFFIEASLALTQGCLL